MKIVEFSLKRRVTVSMMVLVIVILGYIAFGKLGLDMLPDLDFPYISVVTTYSGVSSEDIEQNITRKIEQWVSTVSGVNLVKSISQEGQSIVMIEFEWGTNLDFAAQDVRDTVALYENFLPKNAQKPLVFKFNFSSMPVVAYGITAEGMDLKKLKEYVDNEVSTRLERLDGVASAVVFSPEEAEVLIELDKGKLEARSLSVTQIEAAIQAANINLPAGYLNSTHSEYLLRALGEYKRIDQVADTIVGLSRDGSLIFLKDVASVKETSKEIRSFVRMNGKKGIFMVITKSSGANTVLVARRVKKVLEDAAVHFPRGMEFSVFFDMSRIIELVASRTSDNVWQGGLLAMLLIYFFLRNLRPTIAIGIAIPLSIVSTFIAFYIMGYTLNLITLAGLALGVGMLVDNAVVVIENIYRHLEEGKTPFEAARLGASEVGMAIIASTLTTVAVFFPMMFASGVSGKLSQSLAVSVMVALFASLFVSLTIIPMLASWIFVVKGKKQKVEQHGALGETSFNSIRHFYEKLLRRILKNRWRFIWTTVGAFITSVLMVVFFVGKEFMPSQDRAMIFLKLTLPVGTSVVETNRIIGYLELQANNDENVITTSVQVGVSEQNAQDAANGTNPSGSNEAVLYAYLKAQSDRSEMDTEILERWRSSFPKLLEGEINAVDIAGASMSGSSGSAPIEINVFGKDLDKLEELALTIKKEINEVEGIRDLKLSLNKTKPEIQLMIKKEEASRLGLTTYEISRQIQTYTIGSVVSRMSLLGEDRDIRVKLSEVDRCSIESLKRLPIFSQSGKKVYLSDLTDISYEKGAVKIERDNQMRKVTVQANYIDRSLSDVVADINVKLEGLYNKMPAGYFFEFAGQYKDMVEAFKTMGIAFLLAFVLIFAVMASLYENLKFPFINMFTIPLAFIGVALGLFITGKNLGLPSLMGVIMLGGIAVNNGIVMVDYINQLIISGKDRLEAVIEGSVTRLRPILITSLTTVVGMLPMALAANEGSEMRSPMAVTIIGGLLASTFLTLLFIPCIYTLFSKIKTK